MRCADAPQRPDFGPHDRVGPASSVEDVKRDRWTFLTNHAHVLVCLARNPDILLRDVATCIGITERSVQQMVCDLERAGIIVRIRVGRRNRYIVRREEAFRHPLEGEVTVGEFVDLVEHDRPQARRPPTVSTGPTRPTVVPLTRRSES